MAPATAASELESTKAMTLVRARFTPTASAARSRSRTACMARPGRERITFLVVTAAMATMIQMRRKNPWLRVSWRPRISRLAKSIGPMATDDVTDRPLSPPVTEVQLRNTCWARNTRPRVMMAR
jgi:hypothetical protein